MALVYSCCFWFSLRLGGILIASFSLLQGLLTLIACCFGHTYTEQLQDEITILITKMNLLYAKDYLENVRTDPQKYTSLGISFTCMYLFICFMYIYGAYTFKNLFMIAYILAELMRLVVLSALVATYLFILKQNTTDIGLLIGASVAGGFFLLGMFYLWVCATNLPILINEMERDEQAAVIAKLREMLEEQKPKTYSNMVTDFPLTTNNYNNIILPQATDESSYHLRSFSKARTWQAQRNRKQY